MDIEQAKEYGAVIIPIISTIGAFFVGFRSKKLANKKTEISILQDMIASLESRVKERDETIDAMRIKMNDIFNQNIKLMDKVGQMERDYRALQKSYNALNKNSNSK